MRYWCIFCLLFSSVAAFATDTLFVRSGNSTQLIGKYIGALKDEQGKISIGEILKGKPNLKFERILTDIPVFASADSYVWVKFTVKNETGKDLWLGIENPVTDTILFYETQKGAVISARISGDKVPIKYRDIQSNRILFRISNTVNPETIYLRLNIRLPRQFPVYLATSQTFLEKEIAQLFLNGLFYGFILVIVIYNLFLWYVLRDKSYLYYILYLLFSGVLLMHFDGITYNYFWPSVPYINDHPAVIASIPIFFACLFVASFLDLENNFPRLRLGLWIICGLLSVACIMSLVGYKFPALGLSQMVAFSGSVYFFFIGVVVYMKGYRPARYYLASWTVLIIGVLLFLAKDMGWIVYNGFTANSLKIGIGAEAVLIAFALADRINFYKAEKRRLEAEKIYAEAEQARMANELENAGRLLINYTENLKQKNQLIEQFKNELTQLELKLKGTEPEKDQSEHIEKLLQSIILTEDDWIEFRKLFDKVHLGYIYRIKSTYSNLTETDIRLITLMKLQLNYREMANMLGVTTEAVRKARQRLRKKLNLRQDNNMEETLSIV